MAAQSVLTAMVAQIVLSRLLRLKKLRLKQQKLNRLNNGGIEYERF
jgi:hypothetical protein